MSAGEFDGLVAVVTGGASGIGLATAETPRGARRARSRCSTATPTASPTRLTGFVADVTDRASVERRDRRRSPSAFGGIDILVNNAGISAVGTVEEQRRRRVDARARHQRHRHGPGHRGGTAVAAPLRGRGRRQPLLDRRAQRTAAAGAVLGVQGRRARPDATRWRPTTSREGIRVNCVSPATVATPFVDRMLQGFADPVAERAALDARQATGRMVDARRGRRRDRLSRQPAVGLDDGHGPRRRRRRDAPAGAPGREARLKPFSDGLQPKGCVGGRKLQLWSCN